MDNTGIYNQWGYRKPGSEQMHEVLDERRRIRKDMHTRFVEGRNMNKYGYMLSQEELSRMEYVPDYPPPQSRGWRKIHADNDQTYSGDGSDSAQDGGVGELEKAGQAPENIHSHLHDLKLANDTAKDDTHHSIGIFQERDKQSSLIDSPHLITNKAHSQPTSTLVNAVASRTSNPAVTQTTNPPTTTNKMAGRGRGGGPPGGLKGASWEFDKDLKLNAKPSELFPAHPNIKAPRPPTAQEKRQVKHYKSVRNRIHRGPLYTQPTKRQTDGTPPKIFSEEQHNAQYNTDSKADIDPFTGCETYSQRMAGKTNTIPKLSGRPFDLKLFPEELWSTLEGKEGDAVRAHLDLVAEKKKRQMNGVNDPEGDARIRAMMDKIHKLGDEDDDDDDDEEAEQDSEFDDDSMGGDYDGEQYFDNGEEDNEDGDGGAGEEY